MVKKDGLPKLAAGGLRFPREFPGITDRSFGINGALFPDPNRGYE